MKKTNNNYSQCAIKKGDLVQIITGKEKGKKGKIIDFDRKIGYVKIEGCKMQTHFKKNAGISVKEGFIHVSNVMLVDEETGKITRYKFKINENEKQRISVKTNKVI